MSDEKPVSLLVELGGGVTQLAAERVTDDGPKAYLVAHQVTDTDYNGDTERALYRKDAVVGIEGSADALEPFLDTTPPGIENLMTRSSDDGGDDGGGDCPECGGTLVHDMGREGQVCTDCGAEV